MGADYVINHRESLVDQVKSLGIEPRYVASLSGTDSHFPAIIELIKPRGHIALIDDTRSLDIISGKPKALSFSWEFMFARSMHQTDDIENFRHTHDTSAVAINNFRSLIACNSLVKGWPAT